MIGQPRSTQRNAPIEDDEKRHLLRRMLELVRERPRGTFFTIRQHSLRVNRPSIANVVDPALDRAFVALKHFGHFAMAEFHQFQHGDGS